MCNSCSGIYLFKKSIDFYNIDIDMYILWYIHTKKKLFTDAHAISDNSLTTDLGENI